MGESWNERGLDLRFGRGDEDDQLCLLLWADIFWILSNSEKDLETTMNELIVAADVAGLEPSTGIVVVESLWWVS